MAKKPRLIWNAWNREHIKKHSVTVAEVEQAYALQEMRAVGKSGREYIISRVQKGRLITIFLSYEKQKEPYVVSARDASNKERSEYYEK